MKAATIVAILLLAGLAHADGRAVAREAAHKAAIRYDVGEYRQALDLFKEAYENFDDPSLLFNIAQCYRQLDDKPQAIRIYHNYLIKLPTAPNREEVKAIIARLEKLQREEQAARSGPPDGTLRSQSGARPVEVVPSPKPVVVAPKPVVVAPKPVVVAPKPVVVAPKPVVATPRPAPTTLIATGPERRTPVYKKWWLWTAVGVVAAAGVGVGLGLGLTRSTSTAPEAPTTFGTAHPF